MARPTLEDFIYDEQYELVKRLHGKRKADNANYGWFVDCPDGKTIVINTKVYGVGVLTTSGTRRKNVRHEWASF